MIRIRSFPQSLRMRLLADADSCLYLELVSFFGAQKRVFVAHAGEHVGAIAILSNEPSLFSCRARADSVVVCFSSAQFAAIAAQYPQALFALTELLIRRLSPFMRAMDYGVLTLNDSQPLLSPKLTPPPPPRTRTHLPLLCACSHRLGAPRGRPRALPARAALLSLLCSLAH